MTRWIEQREVIEKGAGHVAAAYPSGVTERGAALAVSGRTEFLSVQPGVFASVNDWAVERAAADHMIIERSVGLQFTRSCRVEHAFVGHGRYRHSGPRMTLTAFPKATRQVRTYARGEPVQYVGLWVKPERLNELVGLQPDELPDTVSNVLRDRAGRPATISLPLTPGAWMALEAMLSTVHQGPLRQTFLKAKSMELMCEIGASLLPGTLARQSRDATVLADRRTLQIDAAAMVYRMEIADPPSIDELARRVGLNRNQLTSGFMERFECTPAAYSRRERLEWAERMLAEGARVNQVAAAVGYSTAPAFSRAFAEHFDRAPTTPTGTMRRPINIDVYGNRS